MANCCDMKEADLFACEVCGLELSVVNACTCKAGEESACHVPLQCCGKEMMQRTL